MATKGLPKKYAKLGFKKGWALYKKFKGSKGQFNTMRLKTKSIKPQKKRSSTVVTVHTKRGAMTATHSNKMAALKSRLSSALKRARGAVKASDPMEALLAIGEGLGGGVATSYAIGAIPLPASLPRPGAIKAGLQTGAGIALAVTKNKHARYVGYGTAIIGALALIREFVPVPTFAGEVDESLFGESFETGELLGYDENGMPVYSGEEESMLGDPLQGDPLQGDPVMQGETVSPY